MLVFLLTMMISPPSTALSATPGQFRAAVYEHELVNPTNCSSRVCSREEAKALMEINLSVLEKQVVEAAKQGADIILLPEDGIHGYSQTSREFLRPFLEFVPSEADGSNPCYEDSDVDNYIQSRLSCMAADNKIYVAANFGSVTEGCEYCEHGDECFYNTLVVYSNNGSLEGVYHKYNLWTSELVKYDIDLAPKLVTVQTNFGKLGLSVCEDLLWKSPVVDLALEENIDTLLVPLSWWDMFPHQLAHSNEDAWARGLQINLLSANTHDAEGWRSGSGIYSSAGHLAYYHDVSNSSAGKLLVADLDIKPTKTEIDWPLYANENAASVPETSGMFQEEVYDDLFNFVPLVAGTSGQTDLAKVCVDEGRFCCLAEFSAKMTSTAFSLGAFRGDHYKDGSVAGHFRMEMCSVMKCDPNNSTETCRQDKVKDYDFLTTSDTVFSTLKLSATFSDGAKVFPEVLFDGVTLQPEHVNISSDGVLSVVEGKNVPLVSMSLFGRVYEEDAALPDHFCPSNNTSASSYPSILLVMALCSLYLISYF